MHDRIFTVYEKPEATEPSERALLVREGFSFWAFALDVFWLTYKRLWLALIGYISIAIALGMLASTLGLSQISVMLLQIVVKLLLGYSTADLQGWALKRRGYRLGGVLVAESEMHAERRYHEFAA